MIISSKSFTASSQKKSNKSHLPHWWKLLGIYKTGNQKWIYCDYKRIKSRFDRDQRFQERSKLDEALMNKTNSTKDNNPKNLIPFVLNLCKVVRLYKTYRHHVHPKWQDVTCQDPTPEQWEDYNSNTKAKAEIRIKKKEHIEIESNCAWKWRTW